MLIASVWRTSTPEPTRGDGIIWTYVKDVTRYTPLFAKPGVFILQLDNLIQQGLDGVYSSKFPDGSIFISTVKNLREHSRPSCYILRLLALKPSCPKG